jgi:hypothetical protein
MANTNPSNFPVRASTQWDKQRTFYVSDLPRKIRVNGKMQPKQGYADWGYTSIPAEAIPLSRYWWRRFRADSEYCGRSAQFMEVTA